MTSSSNRKFDSTYFLWILIKLLIVKFQSIDAVGIQNGGIRHYLNSFQQIVETPYYVDKTMLIKEVISKTTMVTAPPGSGKSVNIDMLRAFLEIVVDENGNEISNVEEDEDGYIREKPEEHLTENFKLFKRNNLKIYNEDREFFYTHCGQYPVIYCNFGNVYGDSYSEIEEKFRIELRNIYAQHKYIMDNERFNYICGILSNKSIPLDLVLTSSIECLTEDMKNYFNKDVVVLIDNYNTPITAGIFYTKVDIKKSTGLVNRYIALLVKENTNVIFAFITSRIPSAGWVIGSEGNLFKVQYLDALSEYYGLTTLEVDDLLKKLKREKELNTIESRFKGYKLIGRDITIYNTRAVMNHLRALSQERTLIRMIGRKKLQEIFCLKAFRESFAQLFTGVHVVVRKDAWYLVVDLKRLRKLIQNTKAHSDMTFFDDVYDYFKRFLFDFGYFNITLYEDNGLSTGLKFANIDVAEEIAEIFFSVNYYKKELRFDTKNIKHVSESLQALHCEDEESFKDFLNSIRDLFIIKKVRKPKHVNAFYGTLLAIARNVKYTFSHVLGEMYFENRNETTHMTIIRNDGSAVIMLFKFKSESSYNALKEIIDKEYYKILQIDKYKKQITKCRSYIGLHLDSNKTTVSMNYLIDTEDMSKTVNLNAQAKPKTNKTIEIFS